MADTMEGERLSEILACWPGEEEALRKAIEDAILAHWPAGGAFGGSVIAELYRIYNRLTGWAVPAALPEQRHPEP
jgi:hypothetical protein